MPKIYGQMEAAYGQAGYDRIAVVASQTYDEDAAEFQSTLNARMAEVLAIPYGYDSRTDETGVLMSTDEFLSVISKYRSGKNVLVVRQSDDEWANEAIDEVSLHVSISKDKDSGDILSVDIVWNSTEADSDGVTYIRERRIAYAQGGTPRFTEQRSRITPSDPLPATATVVDKIQTSRIVPCWMHKGQTLYLLKDSYYATYCLRLFGNGKYQAFSLGEEVEIVSTEFQGGIWSVVVDMIGVGGITFLMQAGVRYSYTLAGVAGRFIEIPGQETGVFTLPPSAQNLRMTYSGSNLRRLIFAGDYFRTKRRGLYRHTGVSGTTNAWEQLPCRSHIVAPKGSYRRYDLSGGGHDVTEPLVDGLPWMKSGSFEISMPTSSVSPDMFLDARRLPDLAPRPSMEVLVRRKCHNGTDTDGRYSKVDYAALHEKTLGSLLYEYLEYERGNNDGRAVSNKLMMKMVEVEVEGVNNAVPRIKFVDIAVALQLRNHRGHKKESRRYSRSRVYYRLYNMGEGRWRFSRQ